MASSSKSGEENRSSKFNFEHSYWIFTRCYLMESALIEHEGFLQMINKRI